MDKERAALFRDPFCLGREADEDVLPAEPDVEVDTPQTLTTDSEIFTCAHSELGMLDQDPFDPTEPKSPTSSGTTQSRHSRMSGCKEDADSLAAKGSEPTLSVSPKGALVQRRMLTNSNLAVFTKVSSSGYPSNLPRESNESMSPLTPMTPATPGSISSLRERLKKSPMSDLTVQTKPAQRRFNLHQCAFQAALVDYERVEMIGRSNAEVFSVRCRKTGWLYAAKVYSNDGMDPCKHEYQILRALDHPCIPKVHQFYRGVRNSALVMDFAAGQTLERLRKEGPLTEKAHVQVMRGLLSVLSYVHSQGYVHRDISCDNIMFDTATGRLTVIDWNIARECKDGCTPKSESTAPVVRSYSPTGKKVKPQAQELEAAEVSSTDQNDSPLSCRSRSSCSGLSDYGKKAYRGPAENESSQVQRDAYAAGVALRMLRPSDPTLPVVVRRVLAGLLAHPSVRLTAQAASKLAEQDVHEAVSVEA